jgi:hypothetical protein
MPYQPNGDRANGRMYPNAVKGLGAIRGLAFYEINDEAEALKDRRVPKLEAKIQQANSGAEQRATV